MSDELQAASESAPFGTAEQSPGSSPLGMARLAADAVQSFVYYVLSKPATSRTWTEQLRLRSLTPIMRWRLETHELAMRDLEIELANLSEGTVDQPQEHRA
jgi:hypothetical protein